MSFLRAFCTLSRIDGKYNATREDAEKVLSYYEKNTASQREGLESKIVFAKPGKDAYDGKKMNKFMYDEPGQWATGIDPFRANLEWVTNDKSGRVIMKRDIRGKWLCSYHGRPDSEDYKAEVEKLSKFYGNNILCEECGEIGKHKLNCSKSDSQHYRNPTTQGEDRREWEVLSYMEKNIMKTVWTKENTINDGLRDNFQDTERWTGSGTGHAFQINSVLRLSDKSIWSLGEETGIGVIKEFKVDNGRMMAKGDYGFVDLQIVCKHPAPPPGNSTKEERIEVSHLASHETYKGHDTAHWYQFCTSRHIAHLDTQEVMEGIERVLNNDPLPTFTKVEYLKGQIDAFNAAREKDGCWFNFKYGNANDFVLNQK